PTTSAVFVGSIGSTWSCTTSIVTSFVATGLTPPSLSVATTCTVYVPVAVKTWPTAVDPPGAIVWAGDPSPQMTWKVNPAAASTADRSPADSTKLRVWPRTPESSPTIAAV